MLRTLLFLTLAVALAGIGACQSRIDGGTHQAADAADLIEIRPDGIRVTTNRSFTATTQPSGQGDGSFSLAGVGDALGGLTFKPSAKQLKGNWPLGLACFAAAVVVGRYLKRYIVALGLAGLGVLAILNPALASYLSAAAVLVAGWASWRMNVEQMAGTQAVLERYPSSEGEIIKAEARAKHSPQTQAAIKARLGKRRP